MKMWFVKGHTPMPLSNRAWWGIRWPEWVSVSCHIWIWHTFYHYFWRLGLTLGPFLVPYDHFWHPLGTHFALQNRPGRPRSPKGHHHGYKVTLLGTLLESKIWKSCAQRHLEQGLWKCVEKVFPEGAIFRSSTRLKYRRVVQNQAFQLFRKDQKTKPYGPRFWYNFWAKVDHN